MFAELQTNITSAPSVQLCGIEIAYTLDNDRTLRRSNPAASTPDLLEWLPFESMKGSQRVIVFGQIRWLELILKQQWARTRWARG
jgi:hypothetical protein